MEVCKGGKQGAAGAVVRRANRGNKKAPMSGALELATGRWRSITAHKHYLELNRNAFPLS